MKLSNLFRRGCALTLAAAVVTAGLYFPSAGAADSILSYDAAGGAVSIDTAAARAQKQSVSNFGDLETIAQQRYPGYTAADYLRSGGMQFAVLYKAAVNGLEAPRYEYVLLAANTTGSDKAISAVNGSLAGEIIPNLGTVEHAPSPSQNAALGMPPEETEQPEQEPEQKQEAPAPETKPEEPLPEGKPGGAVTETEPDAGPQEPAPEVKPETEPEQSVPETKPEQPAPESVPETKPEDPAPETKPEPPATDQPAEQTPIAAAFGFGTRVIGPRAVLSGAAGENGGASSGWVLAPGAVEGYRFTETGAPAAETVQLLDKKGNVLSGKIDPLQVFGFNYRCKFDSTLSLAELAGSSFTVSMSDFGNIFNLGQVNGQSGNSVPLIWEHEGYGSFQIGSITIDPEAKTAAITMLSAEDMQANSNAAGNGRDVSLITDVFAQFSMSCEYNQQGNPGGVGDVTLGDSSFTLDWTNIDANGPKCTIEKKELANSFDAANRIVTWKITLKPENDASLAGATLTDTLAEDNVQFTGLTVGGAEVALEDAAVTVSADGKTLTYMFDGNWAVNQSAEVLVKTQLLDGFFASGANWTVHNTADVESAPGEHAFPKPEPAQASKTFASQFLSKSGKFDGAASNTITWTLTLTIPFHVENPVIYDLLPADTRLENAAAVKAPAGFTPAVITVTSGNKDTVLEQYPNLPDELKAEISGVTTQRDLLVLTYTGNLAAGSYKVTFPSHVVLGANAAYQAANKAYLTYDIPSVGGGQGGGEPSHGQGVSANVTVDYAQAAIAKKGKHNRANHCTTWTIDANNNTQALTGGVKIVDNLNDVLKTGWPGESILLTDTLKWWTGNNEPAAMERAEQEYGDPAAYPEAPVYAYDGKNTLTIYVKEMDGATYHFSFETEGVGKKFFGQGAADHVYTGNEVQQNNTATLYWNGTTAVAKAPTVTVSNKFFEKTTGAPKGESAGYNPADNTQWFAMHINADGRSIMGAKVKDVLPNGVSYVQYKLYHASANGQNDARVTRGQEASDELGVAQSGQTVTFDFGNLMENGARYLLYVQVRIDPTKLVGSFKLTNKAYLSGMENGRELNSYDWEDVTIKQNSLKKTGGQIFDESGKAVYEVKWQIDANLDGKANGYENPTVIDELPAGATLKSEGGVAIYQYSDDRKATGENLAETELRDAWSYTGNQFTFTLPNVSETEGETRYHAYKIVLHADIDAACAGTTMTNTAKLVAQESEIGSGSTDVNVFYFGAQSGGTWNEPPKGMKSLQVTKASAAQTDVLLSGARFRVSYSLEETGEDNFTFYGYGSTNAQGKLNIAGLPSAAKRVKLVETNAPDGYLLPESADNGIIVALDDQKTEKTVVNAPYGALTVIKRDAASTTDASGDTIPGVALAGARFTLEKDGTYYNFAGKPITETVKYVTTGEDGKLVWSKLPMGTYTLTEVGSPSGYNLGQLVNGTRKTAWKITLAQAADGTVTVSADDTALTDEGLTVLNDKSTGGGGGGHHRPDDPVKPADPDNPAVDIPDEETPLSPGDVENPPEVDIPEEETPLSPGVTDDTVVEIGEEDVPKADASQQETQGKQDTRKRLPQTGGFTPGLMIPFGAMAAGLGLLLRYRRKEEDDE
ncbi:MAG: SpaA isopeptide-forming pilin-related protein [Eubacteriales bacterium]|nr:SpaA isopeptide-forming pilin-related protein [Eubacteriales bacterium]